jgi:tetratricopeptide (TPR) repeat protein
MAAEPLKYRAFLSYSHRDSAAAKRLHSRLEAFRIDKDLVGRATAMGPIPKQLRPIFRDRHDFDAGGTLGEQTVAALDDAGALIILASPASASSKPVDAEVRLFQSRHPDRPLIPLILDGEPGSNERECLPQALRATGEVLAADLRDSGDGRELALAKVVARLLGLAPDEVFRRAERLRRRQARIRHAIVGVLALLAVAATGSALYAWHELKTNEAFLDATLKTATDIVNTAVAQADKYNVPRSATIELLSKAEGLFGVMARYGRATPELRYRKAWMLIQFARSYAIVSDTGKEAARAQEAHQLLAGLAKEKPSDGDYQWSLAAADGEVGDVLVVQGNLAAALTSYRDSVAIFERLAKSDPGNAGCQRELSASYWRVGNVLVAQGNLAAALGSYRDSVAIFERLAKSDPGNADWQGDLSGSYESVGDVLVAQGNQTAALDSYRDSVAILERLAKSDPGNAGWQRELSVSYESVGDVLVAQGNLAAALGSYRDSLVIRERLAKSDPGNAGWQRDLSASYERVGDVLLAQGNQAAALGSYRDGLAIFERLAKSDPGNAGWQRDLSTSYDRVGNVLLAQDNLAAALGSYHDSLVIRERLAKSDLGNADWQHGLSVSYDKVGNVLLAQDNLAAAGFVPRQRGDP